MASDEPINYVEHEIEEFVVEAKRIVIEVAEMCDVISAH